MAGLLRRVAPRNDEIDVVGVVYVRLTMERFSSFVGADSGPTESYE